MNDLLGGQTTFMFDSLITSLPHVRAASCVIAVTSPKRSAPLPDVPTFAEPALPTPAIARYGIHVPGKTPPT